MKTGVVNSKELGVNCWSPCRFLGGRCPRFNECSYPEKKECKAREAEVAHLKKRRAAYLSQASAVEATIKQLEREEA